MAKRNKAGSKKGSTGVAKNDFIKDLLKESDNSFASLMEEETLSNTTGYINTGSYALNGLIIGDILKGIPNNKTIAFAGMEGCGKTYLALECVKNAVADGYLVAYFDSENAVDADMLEQRGIDTKKVMYFPIATVEDFRDQLVAIVNKYNAKKGKEKPKLMVVLDSLGNLSTRKEVRDVETGNDKRDMTRAGVIKSIFRVLNLKLAQAKIPMIITNHVYDQIGAFFPTKILSGGSGLKYAASIIIYLIKSKAKNKAGDVIGIYMNCKAIKNRFCRPDGQLKIYLDFSKGLNPYYGLEEFGKPVLTQGKPPEKTPEEKEQDKIARKAGKKVPRPKKTWLINGKAITEKELWGIDWNEYFPGLMEACQKNIAKKFDFGETEDVGLDELEEELDGKETSK